MAQLERRGVPCVCLTGHPFVPLGKAYAKSLDYPARLVVFDHPIAGKSEGEIREKAEGLADTVIKALLGVGLQDGVSRE